MNGYGVGDKATHFDQGYFALNHRARPENWFSRVAIDALTRQHNSGPHRDLPNLQEVVTLGYDPATDIHLVHLAAVPPVRRMSLGPFPAQQDSTYEAEVSERVYCHMGAGASRCRASDTPVQFAFAIALIIGNRNSAVGELLQ